MTVAPPTGDGSVAATAAVQDRDGGVSTRAMPLSVGRTTRTVPAHIRTALHLRDRGCRFPGCDRLPAWTEGHHIIHWADGGPTKLGTWSPCAGPTTARCTSKAGASGSRTGVPSWSRLPEKRVAHSLSVADYAHATTRGSTRQA